MIDVKDKKWPTNLPQARKGKQAAPERPAGLQLAAMGMEAEFELYINEQKVRPEIQFGDPRAFLSGPAMHRVGTSYHLPTGGAVYFDSGVIEVATPVIEIARGCAARAGRSLWEAILHLRNDLDRWEMEAKAEARLVGFSTHYNVSFEIPPEAQNGSRTVEKLAYLLTYLLPPPVMLLAANPRSTGVGVRPRGDRIEITCDFTPSPALMIATGTLIVGIVRAVMEWPSYEVDELDARALPVIEDFEPMPHTSRKGWLARNDCYTRSPFTCGPDAAVWAVREGFWQYRGESPKQLSLRTIAVLIARRFRAHIRRYADPFTFQLINRVLLGEAPSLLDLDDRPEEYEDVGRLCFWDNLFPEHVLARSRYERVLIRAIGGHRLRMNGTWYTPVGLRGWSEVVFRRDSDGEQQILPLDLLLRHLDAWERNGH